MHITKWGLKKVINETRLFESDIVISSSRWCYSNYPMPQEYINKILAEKFDIFSIMYLNDILIYIRNSDQEYIKAVWWILDILRKNSLFVNLKKCWF